MIPTYSGEIPWLSAEQMIEVDRAMMEDYRIDLVRMMENAGRGLATLARERFLDAEPIGRRVTVLAGTGGNGGGALVAARRLHNWGAEVQVYVTKAAERFASVPRHQLDILNRMTVPVEEAERIGNAGAPDLILDGVIGYSLRGAPEGSAAQLIRWSNAQTAPVLALDAPSGLDTTTGTVFDPAVRATATMTLALPKEGLRAAGALSSSAGESRSEKSWGWGPATLKEVQENVGELYLADISVPPALYANEPLGLTVGPIFAAGDILRLG